MLMHIASSSMTSIATAAPSTVCSSMTGQPPSRASQRPINTAYVYADARAKQAEVGQITKFLKCSVGGCLSELVVFQPWWQCFIRLCTPYGAPQGQRIPTARGPERPSPNRCCCPAAGLGSRHHHQQVTMCSRRAAMRLTHGLPSIALSYNRCADTHWGNTTLCAAGRSRIGWVLSAVGAGGASSAAQTANDTLRGVYPCGGCTAKQFDPCAGAVPHHSLGVAEVKLPRASDAKGCPSGERPGRALCE